MVSSEKDKQKMGQKRKQRKTPPKEKRNQVRVWAIKRAASDQARVLDRAFESKRVGDIAKFEGDLRECVSRGNGVASPSALIAAHELSLFLLSTRPQDEKEADCLLSSLGFQFRLSEQVLAYSERDLPQQRSSLSSKVVALDSVLDPLLLWDLRKCLK